MYILGYNINMNTFDQKELAESKDFKSNFTEVTKFSKIVATVVFITLPFVGFYLGTKYCEDTLDTNVQQIPKKVDSVEEVQYKKTFQLDAELPLSWSTYHTSDLSLIDAWPPEDSLQKHAYFSAASDSVVFYDWNANQIDVYILTNKASKEYVEYVASMSQNDPEIVVEQKIINGANAYVVTWPLDNGEVTKIGSGGKSILWATGTSTDSVSVLVNKQALGDKSFEDAFSHFVNSIDVSKWNGSY